MPQNSRRKKLDLTEAPRSQILRNVQPMLCRLVKEPFDRAGWIFEIKWDGFRAISEIDGKGVNLYSRNQRSFNKRFPEIVRSLEALGDEAVLDGEVVALDDEGKSRFEWMVNPKGKGQLVYYVFDVLYLDGHDLRTLPLIRRKALLERIVAGIPHVFYVDHIEEHGRAFFNLASQQGLEGIVGKDTESPYVSGRETWHWLKIKNRRFERKEPVEFKIRPRRR